MADSELDGQSDLPVLREIAERLGNNAVDRDEESIAGLLASIVTGIEGLQTSLDTANGHLATIASNTTPA